MKCLDGVGASLPGLKGLQRKFPQSKCKNQVKDYGNVLNVEECYSIAKRYGCNYIMHSPKSSACACCSELVGDVHEDWDSYLVNYKFCYDQTWATAAATDNIPKATFDDVVTLQEKCDPSSKVLDAYELWEVK